MSPLALSQLYLIHYFRMTRSPHHRTKALQSLEDAERIYIQVFIELVFGRAGYVAHSNLIVGCSQRPGSVVLFFSPIVDLNNKDLLVGGQYCKCTYLPSRFFRLGTSGGY